MEFPYLRITLETDDGGLPVAVFNWVEVTIASTPSTMHIDAQPWVRYERVSPN